MDYETAVLRGQQAKSFSEHPYWGHMSRMLTGTIQAETEEMLAGDGKLAVNRASVAMCRKVLQMPFFDMEQAKAAIAVLEAARKGTQTQEHKERIPWLREVK